MKSFFTEGFYKFLLGFSAIIVISFGVLFYLGTQNTIDADTAEQESQLAQ